MKVDLLVIGAGSAGLSAAKRAKDLGASVVICEKDKIGGTCVNRGCVPKKWLVYAAEYGAVSSHAAKFGWSMKDPELNWKELKKNVEKGLAFLNTSHETRLSKKEVPLIKGEAQFVDEHSVQVGGETISAQHIIIATGTTPFTPDIEGVEYGLTSDDMFQLESLPKRLAIVGGGYIACEFASIMNGLGVKVQLIYRGTQILKELDADISTHLLEELKKKGIEILLETDVLSLKKNEKSLSLSLSSNETLNTDALLFATGRKADHTNLGLEKIGVHCDKNGLIKVDEQYRSSKPQIYAAGDVVGKSALTPVAIREGRIIAEQLFAEEVTETLNYDLIPTAIYSSPPVAVCGLSEEEARKQFKDIEIFRTSFRPLKNVVSESESKTMMKILVNKSNDQVVGVHMVGEDAPEIIQMAAIALTCNATKAQFDATIAIHPTAAEEFVTQRTPVA